MNDFNNPLPTFRSLSAMTSEHGRLLAESGFGKQVSQMAWSRRSELTTMHRQTALSCLSRTSMDVLYSGKRGTASIQRTGVPSTSAVRSHVIESMYASLAKLKQEMQDPSCLSRTYSLPSRLVPAGPDLATQSWELNLDPTHSHGLLASLQSLLPCGRTTIRRDKQAALISRNDWTISEEKSITLPVQETRRR